MAVPTKGGSGGGPQYKRVNLETIGSVDNLVEISPVGDPQIIKSVDLVTANGEVTNLVNEDTLSLNGISKKVGAFVTDYSNTEEIVQSLSYGDNIVGMIYDDVLDQFDIYLQYNKVFKINRTLATIANDINFDGEVNTYFDSVSNGTRGVAYDSTTGNLITCDVNTDVIYIHDGISSTVTSSFATPASTVGDITVDGSGNLISCDSATDTIYIHDGLTSTITSSFASPSASPIGLAVDGSGNLISCDNSSHNIYIHSGITSTVSSSFSAPATSVSGLAVDGSGNLISCDFTTDTIYIHSGITSTVSSSYVDLIEPHSLTIDSSGNLISAHENIDRILIHDGLEKFYDQSTNIRKMFVLDTDYAYVKTGGQISEQSEFIEYPDEMFFVDIGGGNITFHHDSNTGLNVMSTDRSILESEADGTFFSQDVRVITSGPDPRGCTIDGSGNLITTDVNTDTINIHDGLTSTITSSFASPSGAPEFLAIDGSGNLISTNGNTIYVHSGITSTISTSFASPGASLSGIAIDGSGNLISCDDNTDLVYIHSGITSTVSSSFASPWDSIQGIVVDGSGNLISGDLISDIVTIHSGITATLTTTFPVPKDMTDLALDGSGNLIVSDNLNNVFYKLNGISSPTPHIKSFDHIVPSTSRGLVIDEVTGNLLVSDEANSQIRIIDPDTMLESSTLTFGTAPRGIAIDSSGNLLVNDGTNLTRYVGITTTVDDSVATPNTSMYGIHVFGDDKIFMSRSTGSTSYVVTPGSPFSSSTSAGYTLNIASTSAGVDSGNNAILSSGTTISILAGLTSIVSRQFTHLGGQVYATYVNPDNNMYVSDADSRIYFYDKLGPTARNWDSTKSSTQIIGLNPSYAIYQSESDKWLVTTKTGSIVEIDPVSKDYTTSQISNYNSMEFIARDNDENIFYYIDSQNKVLSVIDNFKENFESGDYLIIQYQTIQDEDGIVGA